MGKTTSGDMKWVVYGVKVFEISDQQLQWLPKREQDIIDWHMVMVVRLPMQLQYP